MKKLSLAELGRVDVDTFRQSPKVPVCVVLDNVRSLHNVGSTFRTADAFNIEKIYLTGITGTPPHREIHKTALGATESVAWEYAKDPLAVLGDLHTDGYRLVAVEQTTESIPLDAYTVQPGTKYCLVFGNELHGVTDAIIDAVDQAIVVPQDGTKHSLNVAVCLGIVLWDFYKKLRLS
jgi:23S rRNA (guanosine2251-2'-O)-methyltransferase